jgi:hypothetical protein
MSDFAAFGEVCDVFTGTKRQRHYRHRWLTATRSDQAAPVTDEKVGNVMRAMEFIDHACARIVPHATRA